MKRKNLYTALLITAIVTPILSIVFFATGGEGRAIYKLGLVVALLCTMLLDRGKAVKVITIILASVFVLGTIYELVYPAIEVYMPRIDIFVVWAQTALLLVFLIIQSIKRNFVVWGAFIFYAFFSILAVITEAQLEFSPTVALMGTFTLSTLWIIGALIMGIRGLKRTKETVEAWEEEKVV